MPDEITNVERDRIRSALAAHMKLYGLDEAKVARIIAKNSAGLGGKISADSINRFLDTSQGSVTVGVKRVALLDRYLQLPKDTWESQPTVENRPPPVFPALQSLFRMRPAKADQFRDKVTGVWAFYAYSEWGRSRVCRGGIEFTVVADGELRAKEVQKSVPFGSTLPYYEWHSGHFLFRKNTLIAILREKIQSLPKFYILSLEPFENDHGQYMVMTGTFLKIGAKQDVFAGKVHMIRDHTALALDKADMIPASEVAAVLPYLD
jgi:hypothetical protein